jgi:hypothetical protein
MISNAKEEIFSSTVAKYCFSGKDGKPQCCPW